MSIRDAASGFVTELINHLSMEGKQYYSFTIMASLDWTLSCKNGKKAHL